MTRDEIERLVRLENLYGRIGNVAIRNLMSRQLERERVRLEAARQPDLVTQIREAT